MGPLVRSLVVAAAVCAGAPAFAQGPDIDMTGDVPPEVPPDDAPPAATPPADAAVVKDPKVARTWLNAGDTLVRKGDLLARQGKTADAKTNYENAATAYQKAIEASEDGIPIYLQLATALDKAGDSPGAMKALKVVIAAQATAKPDLVKKAQTKLDELSMKIGVVTLTIIPEGTAVMIGGKPIGEAPLSEPLVLMPGTHVVSFAAVGYQPKDVELKVEAGSESERKIELEPVSITTQPEEEQEVDNVAPTEPKKPSLLPIYIGGGAAAGLLVIGSITGIAAIGKAGQYDDSVSATERADIRSSGKTLALVTDLCIVGAIGAGAFTAYWYLYKYRPVAKALAERQAVRHPKRTPATAKVDVMPWVQPEVGGLMAVGSF